MTNFRGVVRRPGGGCLRVARSAIATQIKQRTDALLKKLGDVAVSSKPIVMKAEFAYCPNITIIGARRGVYVPPSSDYTPAARSMPRIHLSPRVASLHSTGERPAPAPPTKTSPKRLASMDAKAQTARRKRSSSASGGLCEAQRSGNTTTCGVSTT